MQEIDFIRQSNPIQQQSGPFLLGIAGGSGSGKTFFSMTIKNELKKVFGTSVCEIVYQDNFYIDQSDLFDRDGGTINFDHPGSIDFSLLAEHLKILKSGRSTEIPIYDFATHKRTQEKVLVAPLKIIIVDGILIFHSEVVRNLFDELLFFDTPEDLRFTRRLERDVKERGRTEAGVREQFYKQVKPMHDQFVEPSKVFANSIINDVGYFDQEVQKYSQRLAEICNKSEGNLS
ncbi:MAG: uridine kinase [Bdellovibrionota bacterium]